MENVLEAMRTLFALHKNSLFATEAGIDREAEREILLDALSSDQLNFCFVLAVILDLDSAANRLQREIRERF